MANTAVAVHGLTKRYGKLVAINNVSFEVQKGEVFGLLGPNGAGKSTTLGCIEGLLQPDAGVLQVEQCNPQSDRRKLNEVLGVQLQSSCLPEGIRPTEAMALVCSWHGLAPRLDLLERFGLDRHSKKQYGQMSTGQKRRLHLALALAGDPAVVILDEPTAGLDVEGRFQLHAAIRDLKEAGVAVLLATHDMAEAETLCDRIAILIRGQLATIGTPTEITLAGQAATKITLRTQQNCLLPGRDLGDSRFLEQAGDYGVWLSNDAASAVMELLQAVRTASDAVEDLRVERPSLEERFLELVQAS